MPSKATEAATDFAVKMKGATDAQIARLRTESAAGTKEATVEAAVLAAAASRESNASQLAVTTFLDRRLKLLSLQIEKSSTRVSDEIEAFTAATAQSGRDMNRWTKWMAVSSIALAAFTALQIGMALYSLFSSNVPQVIVVMPPR